MRRFATTVYLSAGALAFGNIFSLLAQTAPVQPSTPISPLPVQRWWHKDPDLFLLAPKAAVVSTSDSALGSMMSSGWRLNWEGASPTPGEIVSRFSLGVAPANGGGTETEVLQIGVSRDPASVSSCLSWGLKGSTGRPENDRIIGGHRFTVWSNRQSGMNQTIAATDLRAVLNGACYAIERFSYSVQAADADPSIALSESDGAKALDAALASLRFGPVRAGNVLMPLPR